MISANVNEMIVKLHKLGVSGRGIAELLDISEPTVRKYLTLSGYKAVPHNGNTICVHHINGNSRDNSLSNLKLIKLSEHQSQHRKKHCLEGFAWCIGCQDCLPTESFGKSSTHWNGLRKYCKDCRRKKHLQDKEDCKVLGTLLEYLEV